MPENKIKLPQITFIDFNPRRNMRGADAARFDIVDEEGDKYSLWMSKNDIKYNIKNLPHCKAELERGLRQYA